MIAIEDNFFKQEDYIKVLNCLNSIKQFVPRIYNIGKEDQWNYGMFSRITLEEKLGQLINDACINKFKFKYTHFIGGSGFFVRKQSKIHEHCDEGVKNLLVYLDGQEKFFNGTIWINNKIEDRYSIQVGYVKNRGIHFDANILHTPMSIPEGEDYGVRKFIIIFGKGEYI
jgi:hypothetical protein